MAPEDFVHLHSHSSYSLLDGLPSPQVIAETVKGHGQVAVAVTDHGNLHGVIQHYDACGGVGIKPILGYEAYVAPNGIAWRPEKRKKGEDRDKEERTHLTLLAADLEGYRNLLKLASIAGTEGFYVKPRIDFGLLASHHAGLIVLSGCFQGPISQLVLAGNMGGAITEAGRYRELLGDRYYLEIHEHGMADERRLNAGLVEVARVTGIPLVAANDFHYAHAADRALHDIQMKVQTQGRMSGFETGAFWIKSTEEMLATGLAPAWLLNSRAVADRCDVTLELGKLRFPMPAGVPDGADESRYLRNLALQGFTRHYTTAGGLVLGSPEHQALLTRLRYELETIETTGYVRYFLIVHNLMGFARSRGIRSAARGSAAGSLVLYCLGITDVDPLRYGLLFERFLNEGRSPDIDLDFEDARRHEVFEYVANTYGRDRVAQIITFGTLHPRSAVRDVCRTMGFQQDTADTFAKLFPAKAKSVAEAREQEPVLEELYAKGGAEREVMEYVERLLGIPRQAGVHAAGAVIAADPLTDVLAVQRGKEEGVVVTQLEMHDVERVGAMKFDFLGLKNLSIIGDTLRLVRQHRGVALDLDAVPLDDPATFETLAAGEAIGVFQLESRGMRGYLKELQPSRIEDVMAMVALYRPGPLKKIPQFIARKNGTEAIEHYHPLIAPLLEETYGLLVYQEDLMRIGQFVMDLTPYETDQFLYAVRKKKLARMEEYRSLFLQKAVEKGIPDETATRLWDDMLPFANYGFNRAHACEYAHVAYHTAYLKTHYPQEYMAALLTSEAKGSDAAARVALAVQEARRIDVPVLGPDVNASGAGFTVDRTGVRFGLAAIKQVGDAAVAAILRSRAGGPFGSLADLKARSKVNVRVLEHLVYAGALDSLGRRNDLLTALGKEPLKGYAASLDKEKEVLGLTVSDSPLAPYARTLFERGAEHVATLAPDDEGSWATVAGEVSGWRALKTRKTNEDMGVAELTDDTGTVAIVVFPRQYAALAPHIKDGKVLLARGRVGTYDRAPQLVVERVEAVA